MSCVGCFLGLRCTTRARAYQGAARARWLVLAALAIATTGIWVMHFIPMLGLAIPGQTIRYNVPLAIASMLLAVVVVGIGIFIVGYRGDGPGPLLAGGSIIGVGVACMHYLGMAALQVYAAPGVTVNTSASAFLLPLILSLCSIGFIFSAVIALSPTASEILAEDELMRRIGQTAQAQPPGQQQYRPYGAEPSEPRSPWPQEQPPEQDWFRPRRPGGPS